MNYKEYKKYLVTATNGKIQKKILKQWKKIWKVHRRIVYHELELERDPNDIVLGVLK